MTIPRAGADFVWASRRRRGGSLRSLGARRTWCRRRQQSGSGVPRKRRARSHQCYMAVQPGSWRARAWQEQTAVETRDVEMRDRDRRDQRCSGRHRVDDVGIEVAQDVVAASGELAGNRDRRDLAVVALFHLRVVVVVGAAGRDALCAASNNAHRNVGGPCRDRCPCARRRSEASTVTSKPL